MIFFSLAKKHCVAVLVLSLIIALIYNCRYGKIESDYYDISPLALHPNGEVYVGSASCMECHSDIYEKHKKTAHYLTSAIADTLSIKGNFNLGNNQYKLGELLSFEMVKTDSGLYQRAYFSRDGKDIYRHRMDIVMGSGTKGQSYLTWNSNDLFQLQVSYFEPLGIWINSPGANPGVISKLRPVNNRCLECHTTFAKNVVNNSMNNTYDKNQILLGIGCESCHGPLGKHVQYHKNNLDAKDPKHVTGFGKLSQQQRLDACALCHAGIGIPKRPSFSFLSGDRLSDYLQFDEIPGTPDSLDVHGNQYGLLTASKCFMETNAMSCTTCHDPHKNQRGKTSFFNEKCLSCHDEGKTQCNAENQIVTNNQNNCIQCHMPLFDSKAMRVQLEKDTIETPVKVRTHYIGIYPKEQWVDNPY